MAGIVFNGREILDALGAQVFQYFIRVRQAEGIGIHLFCQGGILSEQLIHGSEIIHHLVADGLFAPAASPSHRPGSAGSPLRTAYGRAGWTYYPVFYRDG